MATRVLRMLLLAGFGLGALTACQSGAPPAKGGPAATAPKAGPKAEAPPTDPSKIQFWHTQTQDNAKELEAIVADFNAAHPQGPAVQATYIGKYSDLFEKVRALAADKSHKSLPDLAVAYESMIADYMAADIVRPLDDLIADAQTGLDKDSLADIHQVYLDTNRFPQFNNQMLSFPFTKSNLVFYYNEDVLAELKLKVPETWDEFVAACRKIKAKKSLTPLACGVDASTDDGLILSMGGPLLATDRMHAAFDQPATLDAFKLWNTLYQDGLAYQVVDKDDQTKDFATGKAVFAFRTSAAQASITKLVAGKFKWGLKGLPHKAGAKPVTVMFGANICIFKSQPDREKVAWEFIKFFTSPPITARWATATGYLPVRKSAAKVDKLAAYYAAAPLNRAAYDLLPQAVSEPNIAGWQSVRKAIETAETGVATQVKRPEDAVKELQEAANKALSDTKR